MMKQGSNSFINKLSSLFKNKRILYLFIILFIVLLAVILRYTYSIFVSTSTANIANIRVNQLEYNVTINGINTTIISSNANSISKSNVKVTSLNDYDSKYEVIYKVCTDSACNNEVSKPTGLTVYYSSITIDSVNGSISYDGTKVVRLVVENTTGQKYYVMLDLNAGFDYNTLELSNMITLMYDEDDLMISTYIRGAASNTFPSNPMYYGEVSCNVNGGNSNASGSVSWNGYEYVLSISGVDTGLTRCRVDFEVGSPEHWNDASSNSLLGKIKSNYVVQEPITNPGKEFSKSSESIMSATLDDYGTSYYFRGRIDNNFVSFANKCWRIVRVTGDGNIKLVLYYNSSSSCSTTNATGASISDGSFNGAKNDNTYIGFMYGSASANSYLNAHSNVNKSNILNTLETWYVNNIQSYSSKLADVIWCNDKSLSRKGRYLGYSNNDAEYSAKYRLNTTQDAIGLSNVNPTLYCPNDNLGGKLSKFTVSDTTLGNGNLSYPIGLLTADEVVFAGGKDGSTTSADNNYLTANTGGSLGLKSWWTMSPTSYTKADNTTYLWQVGSKRGLGVSSATTSHQIRPAIVLKWDTVVSGSGTTSNPYVVS